MTTFSTQELQAYENGTVELKQLLGLSEDYLSALKGRAQFFVDGGHRERALIMLEMLCALDRHDPAPALLAAELYLEDGASDTAEAHIEAVLARAPNCAEALVAKAELLLRSGELTSAAALLRSVLATDSRGQTSAGQRALAVAAQAHARLQQHG